MTGKTAHRSQLRWPIIDRMTCEKRPRVAALLCAKRCAEASLRRKGIRVEKPDPGQWWKDHEEEVLAPPEARKMVRADILGRELGNGYKGKVADWAKNGRIHGELRLTKTPDRNVTGRLIWWVDESEARAYNEMSIGDKIRYGRNAESLKKPG